MMRKVFTLALLLMSVYSHSQAYFDDVVSNQGYKDQITYILDSSVFEAALTNAHNAVGEVNVPSVLTNNFWETWWETHTPNPWLPDPIVTKDGTYKIVAISDNGFYEAKNVTKVVIPNSVKSITAGFGGCINLEEVVFPSSVNEFSLGFSGCEKLERVSLPRNINKLNSDMFKDCISLQTLAIPASVTKTGTGVFSGCTGLTSISLPNRLTSIEGMFFAGCSNLTDVIIPIQTERIGWSAFAGCLKLPSVVIPSSVKIIEEYAFVNCASLLDIDSKIAHPYDIPESAFDEYTYKNATLHVPQGTKSKYKQCKGWKNFLKIHEEGEYDMTQLIVTVNASGNGKVLFRDTEIRDGSREFDVLTFFGRDLMFDIIPDEGYHIKSVTRNDIDVTDKLEVEDDVIRYIQYDALKGMTLSVVFEKDTESDVFTVKNSEGVDITYSIIDREAKTCQVGTGQRGATAINTSVSGIVTIPTIVNGYYVVSIGSYAFRDCSSLTGIRIPPSVKSIGNNSFLGCQSISKFDLPDGLVSIGEGAFAKTGISSIQLPRFIATIDVSTFYECLSLESIIIPEGIQNIREGAFWKCRSLKAVSIPASIKRIYNSAFKECDSIVSVTMLKQDPPGINDDVFTSHVFQNAILYVPKGCKSTYQLRSNWAWCEFRNILELTDHDEPDTPDTPDQPQKAFLEYFIDKDPGYGRANVVTEIGTGNNELELKLGSTQPGAHMLYVRTKDEQGRWSTTIGRPLYVHPPVSISTVEYFFGNSDPGRGKGVLVIPPVDAAKPYEFEVSLGNLPVGEHTLNARVKGTDGLWSPTVSRTFTLTDGTGVGSVQADHQPSIIFDLRGMEHNGQRGLHIVRYQNGKTKKVIIK